MVRLSVFPLVIAVFIASQANAYVTVLGPRLERKCAERLAAEPEVERSTRGIRITLEDDPTTKPPEQMNRQAYSVEALGTVEKVREVYAEIFKRRNMSPEEQKAVLDGFERDDRARVDGAGPSHNGLDNTVYFVFKNFSGQPMSVVRATIIRKGEGRRLPSESHLPLPDENRVELERAYNSTGPWSETAAREIMMVLATYLQQYFGSNDYTLYALTDAVRARHYKSYYGFESQEHPELEPLIRYLVSQKGVDFYERYVGHINEAYYMAFFLGPSLGGNGLPHLREWESKTGMHGYIPNLVAQAVILASRQRYAEALEISRRLSAQGNAQINNDYFALWESRAQYSPITTEGDGDKALEILHAYTAKHPLQTGSYNDRALLFLIYELKILLGMERFDEARKLYLANRALIAAGLEKQAPIFNKYWKVISTHPFQRPMVAARARLRSTELLWDLATHGEPYSVSAMHPETYELAARECDTLGRHEMAAHYRRVQAWFTSLNP
jgi:hypothetical protein